MKDFQKSKVYGAESMLRDILSNAYESPTMEVYGSNVVLTPDRNFGSIESIQAYVDAVLRLNWIQAIFNNPAPVQVVKNNGQNRAHYKTGRNKIAIPNSKWAMRELTVLHELAHHLDSLRGHSASFVGIHLKLIEELISPENAFVYTYLLNRSGVEHHPFG